MLLKAFVQLNDWLYFTLRSKDFQFANSSKTDYFKSYNAFHLSLAFKCYIIVNARALTDCTHDNPACMAPT